MIINAEELMSMPEFIGKDVNMIQRKLDAIEIMIRKYTNNNFQNRNIRFTADAVETKLNCVSPYLKVGDTVQISQSSYNDGLYVITEMSDVTKLNRNLFDETKMLITKIEYPFDVVEGVINMMKWEVTMRSKVGIQSETISRHSVTYFNQDSANQVQGYPASLLGFLNSYRKARF